MQGPLADVIRTLEALEQRLDQSDASREAVVQVEWLAATGLLAGALAPDLAAPLRRICDGAHRAVDRLDQHISGARGPKPLPWNAAVDLRRQLADAVLELGRVARLAGDLAALAAAPDAVSQTIPDLNEVVQRAVNLASRRLTGDCDILLDLGRPGPTRGSEPLITQAIVQVLFGAAYTAGQHHRIEVRTREDAPQAESVIRIEHTADGGPPRVAVPLFGAMVRDSVERQGGRVTEHTDDHTAVLEIRLVRAAEEP